jgi:hypothetical protein
VTLKRTYGTALVSTIVISLAHTAARADDAENLAKKLSNPIASLISVPFQYNYDRNIGPVEDGTQNYFRIQPVIPISLNADWNLISRTITPVMDQHDIFPGAGDQFGLNDTTESLFFSPKQPAGGWLIWGAGPVVYLPTGTDRLLSAERWGVGPTAVALTQSGPWTIGILANHIWSVGGDENGTDINSTFLQPFVSYTTKDAWTFSLNTESTYDWINEEWSVPVNAQVTKLFKLGDQPISMGPGVRYWADSPDSGAHSWGFRWTTTLLFPTGG